MVAVASAVGGRVDKGKWELQSPLVAPHPGLVLGRCTHSLWPGQRGGQWHDRGKLRYCSGWYNPMATCMPRGAAWDLGEGCSTRCLHVPQMLISSLCEAFGWLTACSF